MPHRTRQVRARTSHHVLSGSSIGDRAQDNSTRQDQSAAQSDAATSGPLRNPSRHSLHSTPLAAAMNDGMLLSLFHRRRQASDTSRHRAGSERHACTTSCCAPRRRAPRLSACGHYSAWASPKALPQQCPSRVEVRLSSDAALGALQRARATANRARVRCAVPHP